MCRAGIVANEWVVSAVIEKRQIIPGKRARSGGRTSKNQAVDIRARDIVVHAGLPVVVEPHDAAVARPIPETGAVGEPTSASGTRPISVVSAVVNPVVGCLRKNTVRHRKHGEQIRETGKRETLRTDAMRARAMRSVRTHFGCGVFRQRESGYLSDPKKSHLTEDEARNLPVFKAPKLAKLDIG